MVSAVLPEDRLVELVLDPKTEKTRFALWDGKGVRYGDEIPTVGGQSVAPLPASNGLIAHGVVLLPSEAAEYNSAADLAAELRDYIGRYVSLTETFLDVAAYYVLLTWVYDAFNEVPYLRFKGDFGSGKSRALTVLASVVYKPVIASGASTVSPIFHSLDLFRGALVFDEADFRFTDERAELVKIFNNGTMRGFPVLRAQANDKKEFDPRAFYVFGPKIVGMREVFRDYALESRFLSETMQRADQAAIPLHLPREQREEALTLRNKLLMYRFRERRRVAIKPELADPELSPRSNQLILPLLSIINDEAVRLRIRYLAAEQEGEVARDRSMQIEAMALEAIVELKRMKGCTGYVELAVIKDALTRAYCHEFDRPLTSRHLGSIIRHKLHLKSYKKSVYMVELPDDATLQALCRKYAVQCE